ncbi:unnamed protein product [Closterium sp. Naga37s-1]|nr:unnamed protein product [Closterium sp. Naga37s-1]
MSPRHGESLKSRDSFRSLEPQTIHDKAAACMAGVNGGRSDGPTDAFLGSLLLADPVWDDGGTVGARGEEPGSKRRAVQSREAAMEHTAAERVAWQVHPSTTLSTQHPAAPTAAAAFPPMPTTSVAAAASGAAAPAMPSASQVSWQARIRTACHKKWIRSSSPSLLLYSLPHTTPLPPCTPPAAVPSIAAGPHGRAAGARGSSSECGGRAGQRVAHCFLDALTTRLHGTGALRLYNTAFSSPGMQQSRHVYFTTAPFLDSVAGPGHLPSGFPLCPALFSRQ